MEKVDITDTCWLWTGPLNEGGYGKFSIYRITYLPHRLMLAEKLGRPIADGMHAAHAPEICHNRACVNPEHLREATGKENAADRILDGTDTAGSKNPRAILTDADIPIIRADTRGLTTIGKDYGVSKHVIYHIKAGKTWKHIT